MIKAKKTYILLFFLTISVFGWSQSEPYAEILNDEDFNVCSENSSGIVLQIKFYGEAPYGFILKNPVGNFDLKTEHISEDDLTDGVYYYTPADFQFAVEDGEASRSGTFEITEVFDNSISAEWSPGNGNQMSGVTINYTKWAMPSPNAGSDIDSCGLEATLSAIPDPISEDYEWAIPTLGNIADTQDPNSSYDTPLKGTYQLYFQQENGACSTEDTVEIIFSGSPTATLSTLSEVCGTSDQQATLDLSFGGEEGPWDYMITDGQSKTINGATASSTTTETTTVNGETTFSYSWVKDANGCHADPEDISDQATVIDLQPNTNAGENQISCGTDFQLEAVPDKGDGLWTVNDPANIDILSPNDANSEVTATQQNTYTFTWTENNQGCENSDQVQIQFVEPASINFETIEETICEGDVASFPFTVTGTNGPWSLAYETEGNTATFDFSGSSSTLQLSPVETSQYNILSITDDFGCISTLINELDVQVDQMPKPFAGEDMAVCGLQVPLSAEKSSHAQTGQWASADGTFENNDVENPEAVFNSNTWGEQTLTWTETNGLCTASDQVTISFDETPVADAGDDFTLYHQYETTLRAREPVTSQGEWFGEWYIQPGGSGEISNPSQQETLLSGLSHGKTVVEWSVTNGACETETDIITITIEGLTYHTGMSPNQDGVNDFFKIKGAHTIANNELIVFDQNGNVVYRHQNLKEGNEWEGTDLDGSPLDNGIYYFIFEGEGIEPLKDYIVIKRN